MFDKSRLDKLVHDLMQALPKGLREAPKDLEKNFREILKSTFNQMELVTREEFDAQVKVQQRIQQRLKALEAQIKQFEQEAKTKKTKKQ